LEGGEVRRIVGACCGERTARTVLAELFGGGDAEKRLTRQEFYQRIPMPDRVGQVTAGHDLIPADHVLERFDQVNLSTYVFRAPVLFDALARLRSARPSQEEYLTDVFELLWKRKTPARVVGYEVADPDDLMAFNNPQELLHIEEVYRRRKGRPRPRAWWLREKPWRRFVRGPPFSTNRPRRPSGNSEAGTATMSLGGISWMRCRRLVSAMAQASPRPSSARPAGST